MRQAQICRWRENHGRGWGSTIYSGLRIEIEGEHILISNLSHGLRAFRMTTSHHYEFIGNSSTVDVPDEFVDAVSGAIAADDEFRKWTPDFELLMVN
mgnify:CR=1 FL=1